MKDLDTELKQRIDGLIKELEGRIIRAVASDDHLSEMATVLRSIPGIGQVASTMLIAEMPEIGTITGEKAAPLPSRLEDPSRVCPNLHPATEPDAAPPAKLRVSPRCPTCPNGQNSNPGSRSRWIKIGGNVSTHEGVPDEDIGRPCLVEDEDGIAWVKQVKRGAEPGLFHLISLNPDAETRHNVRIKWAARVMLALPAEMVERI